jgi:hypothetical protein
MYNSIHDQNLSCPNKASPVKFLVATNIELVDNSPRDLSVTLPVTKKRAAGLARKSKPAALKLTLAVDLSCGPS